MIETRRDFLLQLFSCGTAVITGAFTAPIDCLAQGAGTDFDSEYRHLASDEDALSKARGFSEHEFSIPGPSPEIRRRRAGLPRRWISEKAISSRARSLILLCEITSENWYSRTLQSPTWPGGRSGVTIGIGYDLGYSTKQDLSDDWAPLITPTSIITLSSACGIRGSNVQVILPSMSQIRIPWEMASTQFDNVLKYYAGQVIAYFPNSDLLSDDSFGALVSLVYNRGSSSDPVPDDILDRRKELREIKDAMTGRSFAAVPDIIRRMKRLWENDKEASGLLKRRDAEAALFAAGLT